MQLLEHLDLQDQRGQEQHAAAGGDVRRRQHDHGERVEVQPAEVGAHPTRPAEPVGVGDVGVEGGEDQVEPEADLARRRAAVAAGGRVPGLVDEGRGREEAVDEQGDGRGREELVDRGPQVPPRQQGDVRDDEGDERERHQRRPESRRQDTGQLVDDPGRHQRALRGQHQERTRPRRPGRLGRLVRDHQPERLEPRGHQVGQAVDAQRPAVRRAHVVGDLLGGPGRLDGAHHDVEQLRELHHLVVHALHQERRVLEARALDRAQELQAARLSPPLPEGGWWGGRLMLCGRQVHGSGCSVCSVLRWWIG